MPRRLIKKQGGIVGAIAGMLLFIMLPSLMQWAYIGWQDAQLVYFTSPTDIFEYEKITPVSNPNSRTEPLKMNSYITWHSGGWDVTYNDVLRCDEAGFVSSDINHNYNNQPKVLGELGVSPWQYNGALPPRAKQCYIEAKVEVCNERQVCKEEVINSDPIYFE